MSSNIKTIAAKICPPAKTAECEVQLERLQDESGIPMDTFEEILTGKEGLLEHCKDYFRGQSACVMERLKNPFLPLPNSPFSLSKALSESKVDMTIYATYATTITAKKIHILKEQHLANLHFSFTRQGEWVKVETDIEVINAENGSLYKVPLQWRYYLAPTSGGGYKLFWTLKEDPALPNDEDDHLLMQFEKNIFSEDLTLSVLGKWNDEVPTVSGIKIHR